MVGLTFINYRVFSKDGNPLKKGTSELVGIADKKTLSLFFVQRDFRQPCRQFLRKGQALQYFVKIYGY